VPATQRLAARFQVTGVDASAEQLRRARTAVPQAEFVRADFTALELEPESFDAVVSFYAFNHVPRVLTVAAAVEPTRANLVKERD
jgi:ubiquinone/menaquinone biosynthesis C-methylase UbiE